MLMLSTAAYRISSVSVGKTAVAQSQNRNSIAEIIKAEGGRAELKRDNAHNYLPTKQGEKLYRGDLLRVTKGTKIVIHCSFNQTPWTVL